ncbi:MAG: ABC transporter ATP-binding protein [Anaerolineaceae bacterium]|nr:ABC transporter ATP-binding protein [Anaerolineaceae bacterium]
MTYIIKIENLAKSYQIKHQNAERYTALRDVITHNVKHMGQRLLGRTNGHSPSQETFWALNDVSFEVQPGERVGIIGRNGAGKSTLLKILSRITEPTRGRVRLRGRVASLLEVGTGFHPELTGRENIFLNGAILGMSRDEIKRKFDEIVAFAEVEKFLDTPVKRYSSGMYVRLAFAVAAHLEPEILVVDEVLAVGDAAFQKKCLGKMEDVAGEGRTVLFVSHNMGMITQLCDKGIYLKSGKIHSLGEVNRIIAKYLNSSHSQNGCKNLSNEFTSVNKKVLFKKAELIDSEENLSTELDVRYPFHIQLEYEIKKPVSDLEITIRIDTFDGRPIFSSNYSDSFTKKHFLSCEIGLHQVIAKIPGSFLMPGTYLLTVGAHRPMVELYDIHEHVMSFSIIETGTTLAKYQSSKNIGIIIPHLTWTNSYAPKIPID